jgi:hypothetical protein
VGRRAFCNDNRGNIFKREKRDNHQDDIVQILFEDCLGDSCIWFLVFFYGNIFQRKLRISYAANRYCHSEFDKRKILGASLVFVYDSGLISCVANDKGIYIKG